MDIKELGFDPDSIFLLDDILLINYHCINLRISILLGGDKFGSNDTFKKNRNYQKTILQNSGE